MLTITEIDEGAKQYFAQIEYHREALSGRVYAPTAWFGKGAAALGLEGNVEFQDFESMIMGFGPNGEALVKNAGDEKRRLGWDLTFSMEKSMSILLADPTAPDEIKDGIVEVHRNARDVALAHLESLVEVRKKAGGTQRDGNVGLVVAMIDHFSSRDLDCQGHSHCVVGNLGQTIDENGKITFNSLDGATLKEYEHALGAVYRAECARGVQMLGLQVNMVRDKDAKGRETGKVFWRVAGVDETTYNASSKRAQEIEAYMEAHPGVERQQANLATRADKDEPTYVELQEQWRKEREELRKAHPEAYQSFNTLMGPEIVSNLSQEQPLDDTAILAKVVEMNSLFKRSDLLKVVAQEYVGRLDAKGAIEKTNAMLNDDALVHYYGRDKHMQHQFSTQAMVDLEASIGRNALARKDDMNVRLTAEQVEAGIAEYNKTAKFSLSLEQVAGVQWLCAETGGAAALTGLAGAGKTSSFLATKTTLELAGRTLIGVSTSWNAAGKLQSETGVESFSAETILRQLKSGDMVLNAKSVVVFDEAGMAGSKPIAALQSYVDAAGAKLIMMGDCLQLQPVSAGAGFRLAIQEIGDAKLTAIRRQQTERLRETASMFYGLDGERNGKPDGVKIFNRLMEDGHIVLTENDKAAKQALIQAYFADTAEAKQKLILAGTRAEVMDINLSVRDVYKERGALGVDHDVRLIVDGEHRTLKVAVNDHMVFTEKHNALGVVNGDGGVVTAIQANEDGKGHRLTVQLVSDIKEKDGAFVHVDTEECKDLTYRYAMTTHKSQGQGVKSVFALFGERGANSSTTSCRS